MKVKSANRVIQILESLASSKYGMQHKDLAEELNIPKGSLTKLLSSLIENSYIAFDSANKTYKLGSRVLKLADSFISGLDIVQYSQTIIRDLVAKTGESASLVLLDGDSGLVVHRQYGNQPMSYRLGIGARIPLYATATGKILLAFLSKEEIDAYLSSVELKPLTHATITDPLNLLRELDSVRSKGIAYSQQERFEGLCAVAAPVFGVDGRVAAAMTIMYLNVRTPSIDFPALEELLKTASERLSAGLGFQSDRFDRVHVHQNVNSQGLNPK